MKVVVVESPAKAKTINKYLGSDYTVLASFGHVRDLPAKDGSVRPDDDFSMSWQLDDKSEKRISDIAKALKSADHLILATDPDREGEAISWHVKEVLNQRHLLNKVDVKRVVFHEITKSAVLDAIARPRNIDSSLVDAYLARRALDYLVGFTLSPVLWRKLPGSRSAGRVQSVALRLICEREAEVEVFKPQEYWSVEVKFATREAQAFTARLTHLEGLKLDRLSLKSETEARHAVSVIEGRDFQVVDIERKTVRRNPYPPFTTSTLQQEASRKLGFSASHTMRLAQRLYEGVDVGGDTVGLITYMRTDSFNLSGEAIGSARRLIERDYGGSYVPDSPRAYKSKAKNAQEAHEAIRPTDLFLKPENVRAHLDHDQLRLYELIWRRTLACQMASAELDQVAVDIASADEAAMLRATGSVVKFDGFLKLYTEDRDDPAPSGDGAEDDNERRLPAMASGDPLRREAVNPEQHFTQPPPRYTEASLVKKLEELGIGRPSTYASIIQVLQDRNYVRLEKKRFTPEDRGRLVTAFLSNYFHRYVEYDFTADLEGQLDDIANGRINWKQVLRDFWLAFSKAVDGTKELRISEVLDRLDEELGPHFFPETGQGDPRLCPRCGGADGGRLSLKLGKMGGFIGCSRYPECRYTRSLVVPTGETGDDQGLSAGPKILGQDPETGKDVTLRLGPYGPYVQLGEPEGEGKKAIKPKRASLPKGLAAADVDLDRGLRLLALPRQIGLHPEDGKPIVAGIGRFGPYIKHESRYVNLKSDEDDVLTIGINRAVTVLAEAPERKGRGAPAGKNIGDHPEDGKPIVLRSGRYGPYIAHGKVNATIPKDTDPDTLTVEAAITLLAARKEAVSGKPTKKPAAKKAPAKKADVKKAPAKKTAAAKSPAKKKANQKKKGAAK